MQCRAIAKDGNRCSNAAAHGQDYCYIHLQDIRLQQAPLRALVLSIVLLVAVFITWYFFPELKSIVSCIAILVAVILGLGVVAAKMHRIE